MKRSPLRRQSKKGAAVQRKLNKLRDILLRVQYGVYACQKCEASERGGCRGPLVLDHVNLRRDGRKFDITQMQILCAQHNFEKGSKRTDYRGERIKEFLKELTDKPEFQSWYEEQIEAKRLV